MGNNVLTQAEHERISRSFVKLTAGLFDTLGVWECTRCRCLVRDMYAWDHVQWHDWLDRAAGVVAEG